MYKGFVQFLNKRWTYYHAVSGGSSGSPELICAEYLLEKGDYLSAHSPLAKAFAAAKVSGELNMCIAVPFTKSRLHLSHGQLYSPRKTFDSVSPAVKHSRHPVLAFMLGFSQG